MLADLVFSIAIPKIRYLCQSVLIIPVQEMPYSKKIYMFCVSICPSKHYIYI
jgi:hypothetical protein